MHARALKCWRLLQAAGLTVEVRELPPGPRDATALGEALGSAPGQLLRCEVWVVQARPLVVLRQLARPADPALVGEGAPAAPAAPGQALALAGWDPDGLPPLFHERPAPVLVDTGVPGLGQAWCAAGTPDAFFCADAAALVDTVLAAAPAGEVRPVAAA